VGRIKDDSRQEFSRTSIYLAVIWTRLLDWVEELLFTSLVFIVTSIIFAPVITSILVRSGLAMSVSWQDLLYIQAIIYVVNLPLRAYDFFKYGIEIEYKEDTEDEN